MTPSAYSNYIQRITPVPLCFEYIGMGDGAPEGSRDPGPGIQDPRPGSRVLGSGSWVPGPGTRAWVSGLDPDLAPALLAHWLCDDWPYRFNYSRGPSSPPPTY